MVTVEVFDPILDAPPPISPYATDMPCGRLEELSGGEVRPPRAHPLDKHSAQRFIEYLQGQLVRDRQQGEH